MNLAPQLSSEGVEAAPPLLLTKARFRLPPYSHLSEGGVEAAFLVEEALEQEVQPLKTTRHAKAWRQGNKKWTGIMTRPGKST